MCRRTVVVLMVAMSISSCGVFGGGTVAPNAWELGDVSFDETELLVSTSFGGVASGCSRFEGWEVSETADQVEVRAMLWTKNNPTSCTDDGGSANVVVRLEMPLGDRELIGCSEEDCRSFQSRFVGYYRTNWSIANDGHVGLFDDDGFRVFDRTGEETDTLPRFDLQLVRASGGLFVGNVDGTIVAYEPMSAATLWSEPGWAVAADDDHIYACQGDEETESVVSQLSPSNGAALWSVSAPCEIAVPLQDAVVLVGSDPGVDGAYQLVVVDRATGQEVVRRPIEDGTDDQVTGIAGGRRVGEHAVLFGWQSNTIVFDGKGTEVARRSERLGDGVGAVDGLLVTLNQTQLFASEPLTGDVSWSIDVAELGELFNIGKASLAGDDLLLVDRGSVTLMHAVTGQQSWTASVGVAENISVSAGGNLVYARTPLSLHALDRATGETVWVRPIPWSGEVVTAAVTPEN